MYKFGLLLFLSLIIGFGSVHAVTPRAYIPKSKRQNGVPYYGFQPFYPTQRDYGFEIGSMWEEQTMYWLGGRLGYHVGKCILSDSQSCQQYWDILGGVGGRDGYTNGVLLTGPRWQFINHPSPISPAVTLFVGAMNLKDDQRSGQQFSYGVGYSLSMALHENLDLRVELRVGGGDHEWSQAFIGLGVKLDSIVTHYASQLQSFGESSVDLGGKVLKGTHKVIKETGEKVIDTVTPENLK